MNTLIIHGCANKEEYYNEKYPSSSNFHWIPWLQKQLLIKGILTQTPEMPSPFDPIYEEWKDVFERFSIDKDTILVGHSCGAGFLLRWLSENKNRIQKLILVAPYLDPKKTKSEFLNFQVDQTLSERAEIHVLNSDDDSETVQISTKEIMDKLPLSKLHQFRGKGHFTLEQMGTDNFPELLDIILG